MADANGNNVVGSQAVSFFDFKDGHGPVPAERHAHGGGWVALSSIVAMSAFVGPNARVSGCSHISGNARVYGRAQAVGQNIVCGEAEVYGRSKDWGRMISGSEKFSRFVEDAAMFNLPVSPYKG